MHWYLQWLRLGQRLKNLRASDWIFQFDRALSHQGYYQKYLKEILVDEFKNGKWDIGKRVNYLERRLRVDYVASQTMEEHVRSVLTTKPTRGTDVCKRCGKQGHWATECTSRTKLSIPEGHLRSRSATPPRRKESRSPERSSRGWFHTRSPQKRSQSQSGSSDSETTRHPRPQSQHRPWRRSSSHRSSGSEGYPSYLTKATLDSRLRNGVCLKCGHSGHNWRNCSNNGQSS